MKKCFKCGIEKELNDFYFRKGINKHRNDCKECFSKIKKSKNYLPFKVCCVCKQERSIEFFHKTHSSCKECRKIEYRNNKEDILLRSKNRYQQNKEIICERIREYRKNNKKKVEKREKEYRERNRELIIERKKTYYQKNKETILLREREKRTSLEYKKRKQEYDRKRRKDPRTKDRVNFRYRERRKKDPAFKLMSNVACRINKEFRENQFSKNGQIWRTLPYTPRQLKEHIENQFTPEMNWKNHGSCWHIDHIIPQSLLKYDSLNHPNFLKCWDLNNLRPLKIKENLHKSKYIRQEEMKIIKSNSILLEIYNNMVSLWQI